MSGLPQPLGRNHGRYLGERPPLEAALNETWVAAARHGWRMDWLETGTADLRLPVLSRVQPGATASVYLSAGIHGDEPAGPLALCDLLRANRWPPGLNLWVCPCLNPSGLALGQRENAAGIDLNRDYRHGRTPEVRAHRAWLETLPAMDFTLCLHEDWEAKGFYLYELNPDQRPSRAGAAIRAVAPLCPIDPSPLIDERSADGGIIRPDLDPALRPNWPEAFFLLTHKTRHSYTLEAPSDFALPVRVSALMAATEAILGPAADHGMDLHRTPSAL